MKNKTLKLTLLIGLLVSMFTIGYSAVDAAAVSVPESGVTGVYDLALGNVTINSSGTYVINQSSSITATANTITINSDATVYLNNINIFVPAPVDRNDFSKNNPVNINGPYTVNMYLVDGTTNKMDSGFSPVYGDDRLSTGSGKSGIRVPAGATLNIYGADRSSPAIGSLETKGATGFTPYGGFAHGGGGSGIGGNGGYSRAYMDYYQAESSGSVYIYGGRVTATGGPAGSYHGKGGNGIGAGGKGYYDDEPSSGKTSLYEGYLTVKGGNRSTDYLSGYAIAGNLDIFQGVLTARSADVVNQVAALEKQPLFLATTEYIWRRDVSSGYSNTSFILNTANDYMPSFDTYLEVLAENTPSITAGSISRTSDTEGTVKFTSNEPGTYYYAVVADGSAVPSINTSGAGTPCSTTETTITNPVGLTPGARDIYIKFKDYQGNVTSVLKLDIPAYVRQVSSWEELRAAVDGAPVGDVETIIEITQNFNANHPAIYGWNDGTTGKKITIQSAEGGPYTITRGAGHTSAFFTNDYDLGTLTLKNIVLDGNGNNITATDPVLYKAGGTWIMDSGAIIQNAKADSGGGSAAAVKNLEGTFIMKSGSQIQNTENIAIAQTGGIYNSGTLIMEGGTITGCKGDAVGGVYSRNSNVTLSGLINVTDNKKSNGSDSNFYMDNAYVVTIAGDGLQTGSSIGIAKYMSAVPANVTTANSKDYSGYFTSDDSLYLIKNTGTLSNQIVKLVSATAPYKVEHYIQDVTGSGYTLYETETKSGSTDGTVSATALILTGFSENTSYASRVASGTVQYDGSTVLKLYYDRDTFTVTFKDHDDDVLDTQIVRYEGAATAPASPIRTGYTFSEWDIDYTDVTANITVKAVYTAKTDTAFKVEHYKENLDGSYSKFETEDKTGTTDTTASASAKSYTGFSENDSHDDRIASGNIEGNGSTVLKLYYDRDTYTVTFKDHDDTVLKTETVKYEGDATAPDAPSREDHIFDEWDRDFTGVTGNLSVKALYIRLNDPVIDIVNDDETVEIVADGLENAVSFTEAERLKDISIRLEVSLLKGDTVPVTDKSVLDSYVKDKLGLSSPSMLMIDLSLFKVVDGTETEITNAEKEIKVMFILPEEYRNRDFYIGRVHEGKVQILKHTYDKETFEVTFRTDKFSTYGVIMKPLAIVKVLPRTGGQMAAMAVLLATGISLISIGKIAGRKKDEK